MKTYGLRLARLAGFLIVLTAAAASVHAGSETFFCSGEIQPPIEIILETDGAMGPRAITEIWGYVEPEVDVEMLVVRFSADGAAIMRDVHERQFLNVAAGERLWYSFNVVYPPQGRAVVHLHAEARDENERVRFARRESLYTIRANGRVYAGRGDFHTLERERIEDELARGILEPAEAAAALRALTEVPARRDSAPVVGRSMSEREQRLNALVGAPPEGAVAERRAAAVPSDRILVEGNVQWTDENGTTHPVFGATVRIMDSDTGFDEEVAVLVTDAAGNYSALIDTNDGVLAGDRDVYVEVRAANSWVVTKDGDGLFASVYTMTSGLHNETPGGSTITENFTAMNNGAGDAFSVFQGATWIAGYTALVHGSDMASVDVVWPNGGSGSFYDGKVQIEQDDRWDWDTIHHEYGHYVADELNIENNPGGPHSIGECSAVVRGDKSEGLRLAWGEGWPTYFGTSGQQVLNLASLGVPRVGDVSYQDVEDGAVIYSLESQDNNGRGEDNELAVQRLLWDLYDGAADGRDTISRSDGSIWTTLNAADPTTLSAGWNALRAGQSNQTDLMMGMIASDHQIGPSLIAPAAGTIVGPSSATFSWNARVGCDSSFAGDSFDLIFYDASTFAKILTIPGIGTASTSLSAAQLDALIAATHSVRWAVEGNNSSSPATGPYLGENFQIIVNRPPTAAAGADQSVECTSSTTTDVSLDGSGSSDPDGDTLSWSWSAPGVLFDDSTSATPTGAFPLGTTVVTLTVSDGYESSTDTVSVTVVDTTPPVIACPADVTVECTGNLGIDASDPQLAAFFAAASATDTCDLSPSISHDAPAFFGLGTTTVTFTATDASGNFSTCTADVTVVDTTPPDITASLSSTMLWPPNHKMMTIQATVQVSDGCDPNPTWVLTSITSNEPDNGLGDGDTAGDIAGADFGTADAEFELRAERSGGGTGRIYTIVYTAIDSSGNTTPVSLQVVVPLEQ